MTDTHGTIQSKGLDGTGFDEDTLAEHFNRVGTHVMAIVDLQVVDKHGPNLKGKRKVTYAIGDIELATDETLAEHLREITRAVYRNRQAVGAQATIDQELDGTSDEPTVDRVVAAGAAHRPHPFLPVDASQDNPICDVCGLLEPAPRHSVQDALPDGDQDDQEPDDDQDETTGEHDPYDDVHGKRGEVTICGLPATSGKSLRRHEDADQVTCPSCLEAIAADAPEEPWEYDAPEGHREPTTVLDPFTAPEPDPTPAA